MVDLKIKLGRYRSDKSKVIKELDTIKDRLSRHNYNADEVKLARYKNQTDKCTKDVASLNKKLKSSQGPDALIMMKKLEMRKLDCANIEKSIETIQLLLVGRDQLVHRQKDLEDKMGKIQPKIKHYEVFVYQL